MYRIALIAFIVGLPTAAAPACLPHRPPPTPAPPTQTQTQTQTQTTTNTSQSGASATGGSAVSTAQGGSGGSGGNGGSSTVNTYVGGYGGQDSLPVAPLAGCDSGSSLSVGGSVGHDAGLLGGTNTTLYAAATIPIGRRHCERTYPQPAPITNVYYTMPPAPPIVISPPAVRSPPIVRYVPQPCAPLSAADIVNRLNEIHRLRHTRASAAIARDLHALRAACVPDSVIASAIDGS